MACRPLLWTASRGMGSGSTRRTLRLFPDPSTTLSAALAHDDDRQIPDCDPIDWSRPEALLHRGMRATMYTRHHYMGLTPSPQRATLAGEVRAFHAQSHFIYCVLRMTHLLIHEGMRATHAERVTEYLAAVEQQHPDPVPHWLAAQGLSQYAAPMAAEGFVGEDSLAELQALSRPQLLELCASFKPPPRHLLARGAEAGGDVDTSNCLVELGSGVGPTLGVYYDLFLVPPPGCKTEHGLGLTSWQGAFNGDATRGFDAITTLMSGASQHGPIGLLDAYPQEEDEDSEETEEDDLSGFKLVPGHVLFAGDGDPRSAAEDFPGGMYPAYEKWASPFCDDELT